MRLENRFDVPAPPDQVWTSLLDVEGVAPCLPGAEITEQVDERTWKGQVSVKLGPVSMAFKGKLTMDEVVEGERRVVLRGSGQETRGKGTVSATITSTVEEADGGTNVEIVTDLTISGQAAQYARGMIGDVSERFTREFAECLGRKLGGGEGTAVAGEPAAAGARARGSEVAGAEGARAKPISGIRLGLWALLRAIIRSVRGFFSRSGGGAE